ncbi:MAG TPA: EAL domain-containing protein [Nitrospiraceae bacterium]|nr:EAL domain-containing protein [Nitrospiraceae bacterium]
MKYSSLNYLRRLPLSTLKIDQSLVCEVTSNRSDAAIVQTIITLARCLKLMVIAEGVETEVQVAFLRDQQCDELQGYYFYLPADSGGGDDGHSESRRRSGGLGLSSEWCGSGTTARYRSGTAAVASAGCDRMGVARMKVTVAMRTDRAVTADRLLARIVIRMRVRREGSPGVGVLERTRRRTSLSRPLFGQHSQAGGVPGQSDDEECQRDEEQQAPRRRIVPQVQQRDHEFAIHEQREHDAGKDHAKTSQPERLLIPSPHRDTSQVLNRKANEGQR